MNKLVNLEKNERIDELHRDGLVIIQNIKNFCFGIDAVLLSHFANAYDDEVVMDIGTGTGIIPILMSYKTRAKKFHAIDIQEELVIMAKKSIIINNLQEKINIFHCDVKDVVKKFGFNSYDVVVSNPPYVKQNSGIIEEVNSKAIARNEIFCTFEDIALNVSKILKNKGRFYLIHKPSRLVDIMYYLRNAGLEPKKIQFVQSYASSVPNLVLIEAIKQANPMLNILPNLIIYNDDGSYTKEIFNIYYN